MRLKIVVTLLSFVLLGGCASLKMKPAVNQSLPTLNPEQSRVVFMRSSLYGKGVEAGMYEVIDEKPVFIGILLTENKIYVDTAPGEHMFMSMGSTVRFMEADLQAGKTYYAMATPRGWPGINFSLHPVRNGGTGAFTQTKDEFQGWLKDTILVEMSPEAKEWAKDRTEWTTGRFNKEWPVWKTKPEDFKAKFTMMPGDGS
jgi:hypothetical protein